MADCVKLPQACSSDPEIDTHSTRRPPIRPKFHHKYTNDRIREGSGTPPTFSMFSKIKKDRKSVFKELGLDDDEPSPRYTSEHEFGYITGLSSPTTASTTHRSRARRVAVDVSDSDGDGDDRRSECEKPRAEEREEQQSESESTRSPTTPSSSSKPWYAKLAPGRRPRIKTVASAPPSTMSSRLSTTALLIAVVLPAFSYYNGRAQVSLSGADAGVIRSTTGSPIPALETRADSPTDVCARWAHQGGYLSGSVSIALLEMHTNEITSCPTERDALCLRRPSKTNQRPDNRHVEYASPLRPHLPSMTFLTDTTNQTTTSSAST